MGIGMTILVIMVGVFTVVGAIRLGKLRTKYQGIFGAPKAYLDIVALGLAALGMDKKPVVQILFLLLAIAVSYGLCVLFTKSLNPITWFDMQCFGWGWTLRLMLSFIGVAMPIAAEKAQRDQEEYNAYLAEQQRQDEIKNEIQSDAYRKYGERGQVSDDNNYWRPDENSDWQKVNRQ